MQTDRQRRRRGQATAELVIGAVGIIVVFFGLIQIAQLGRNSIANLFQARGEAERRSASDLASSPERDYVNDWNDGADALRFTADDTVVAGVDTLVVQTQELDQPPTLGDMLAGYTLSGYDSFTGYLEVDSIAYAADLRKGSATRYLPVEPALQKVMFRNHDTLRLADQVYMPSLTLRPGGPN